MFTIRPELIKVRNPYSEVFEDLNAITGGGSGTCDYELNQDSNNPVKNKTICGDIYAPLNNILADYYGDAIDSLYEVNELITDYHYEKNVKLTGESDYICLRISLINTIKVKFKTDTEYPYIVFDKDDNAINYKYEEEYGNEAEYTYNLMKYNANYIIIQFNKNTYTKYINDIKISKFIPNINFDKVNKISPYVNQNGSIDINDVLNDLNTKMQTKDFSAYISPKDFGAVGDGTTDDTEAIKNTINEAQIKGRFIYIDKGTYLVKDRLIITKPLLIEGASQSESIIKYAGEYHDETAYDSDYYEGSNACFLIKSYNVEIKNLTIIGGDSKDTASNSNGITMHYSKKNSNNADCYEGAERVALTNVDVKYFKNGLFMYGGWNRYITRCHFVDNKECGVKYDTLELSSVGNWSASGDVYIACQFIGNAVAGFYAAGLFETTVWNSVFEYNERAISTNNCTDLCFKNCWNEANYNNIKIIGNCKFEGGYNIYNATVDHELVSSNDLVQFETGNLITMCREGVVVFNQASGIITKGVNIGAEVENLILNPGFSDASGGTSTVTSDKNWYHEGAFEIIKDNPNYAKLSQTGATSDVYRGLWADQITTNGNSKFNIGIWMKTDSRSNLDSSGAKCYIAWKDANKSTILIDNRDITIIGDNNWEYKELEAEAPSDAAYLVVGWGMARNGVLYFKQPVVSYNDSIERSNVYTKLDTSAENKLKFTDTNGSVIGTLDFNEIEDLKKSVSDGKVLLAGAITNKGVNTASTDTFETMANNINNINSGGSTGSVIVKASNIKTVSTNLTGVYCRAGEYIKTPITIKKYKSDTVGIHANTNCYIDTGIKPTSNIKIQIKFKMEKCTGDNFIGTTVDGDNKSLRFFGYNNSWYLDYGNGNSNRSSGGSVDTTKIYEFEIGNKYIKDLSTNQYIINGDQTTFDYSSEDDTIKLLGNSEVGSVYYCKIYDSDTLVRDFIVKKDENNKVGIYDNVSQAFFENKGTGEFTELTELVEIE